MVQITSLSAPPYNASILAPVYVGGHNASPQADYHPYLSDLEDRVFEIKIGTSERGLVEQAKNLFSYFYSKLPTLSLPVAQASTINGCQTPDVPKSCDEPRIKYLHQKRICLITTHCSRESDELPSKFNSVLFHPEAEMRYENRNGTLVWQREIIPEVTENHYLELKDKIKKIDLDLEDPTLTDAVRIKLELNREWFELEALKVRIEVVSRLYKMGGW